jgi:hypothetical protein
LRALCGKFYTLERVSFGHDAQRYNLTMPNKALLRGRALDYLPMNRNPTAAIMQAKAAM